MNELDLILLIRRSLIALIDQQPSMAGTQVVTEYQPVGQGRTNGPTLYFFQLPTGQRYGSQEYVAKQNLAGQMMRSEGQWYRLGYQIMALNDSAQGLPAQDLITMGSMLIGSGGFRQLLRREQVGIERIQDVRSPYFSNDRDRFEMSPSFDFTLSTKRTIIQQSAAVTATELNFARI